MLPRYFNDLYILDKFGKTRSKKLSTKLHHKNLGFNFVIFLLLKTQKKIIL